MAAIVRPITVARAYGLTSKPSEQQPEGADQTFKQGAPLVASSGNLIEASSDPSGGVIVGFAAEDGHDADAAAELIRFYPAIAPIVFEGTLVASNTVAVALAATDRFVKYGLVKDTTTGFWCIDQSETSSTCVFIVGFRDAIGTTDARVYFVVEADKVAWA